MTKCLLCGTDRNRLAGKLTDLRAELEAERQRTAEAREVARTLHATEGGGSMTPEEEQAFLAKHAWLLGGIYR